MMNNSRLRNIQGSKIEIEVSIKTFGQMGMQIGQTR